MFLLSLTFPSCTNSLFSLFLPRGALCRWDTTPQAPLHMFQCIEEHFSGQGCTGGTLFRCLLNRRDIVSGFSKPHSLAPTDSGSREQDGAVLLTTRSEYPNIIHGTGFLHVSYTSCVLYWMLVGKIRSENLSDIPVHHAACSP